MTKRSGRHHCARPTERPIEHAGVAEPVPELPLQARDRIEVLRCTRIFVGFGGERSERGGHAIGEPGDDVRGQRAGCLAADDPGPRTAAGPRKAHVPRVPAERLRVDPEHRSAVAVLQRAMMQPCPYAAPAESTSDIVNRTVARS